MSDIDNNLEKLKEFIQEKIGEFWQEKIKEITDEIDAKIESLREYVDEQINETKDYIYRKTSVLSEKVNGLENNYTKFNKRLLYVSIPAFILILLALIF